MRNSSLGVVAALVVVGSAASAGPRALRRQTAYKALKSFSEERLHVIDSQISRATLETSPALKWTRTVLESPGSDYGTRGVGEVIAEKRWALVSLRIAQERV